MSKNVFISHSHLDADWVREFAASLESQGSKVWLDEARLKPGEPVEHSLEIGLRESDVVAFIVTPESVRHSSFLFELGAAIGMGKRTVPIIAKEMQVSELPFPLRTRVALFKESPDETAKLLLAETQPEDSPEQ
jgi:hypothetical protein